MLSRVMDELIYGLLRMPEESPAAGMLHFFLADTIKIFFLLFVMISVMGFLRSFIPQDRIRDWLRHQGILGNIGAAAFGAVTPFCSCSSIPIFLGFLEAGAPLGVTFSFLITSPIINEYLLVLMLGFFGWKITLVYLCSGIFVGAVGGYLLGRMNLERHLETDLIGAGPEAALTGPVFRSWRDRMRFGVHEAWGIIRKIWLWVLVGVGLGAVIHNMVPQAMIERIIASTGMLAVPLAVLVGVPMYGSCAAIVPVAVVLFQKGVPLGTAIALMMAISALSLPEAVLLRRAMRLPLIAAFFGVVSIYIIMIGYLLNVLQPVLM